MLSESTLLYIVLVPGLMLLFIGVVGMMMYLRERLFFVALSALLLLYMTTGKGFAYLGVKPLYISEMVFALGLFTVAFLAVVRGHFYVGAIKHWSALFVLLFIVWGAWRTLPNLAAYKTDALRDGVIWGYSLIAFCIALLLTPAGFDQVLRYYCRFLPYILLWLVIGAILVRFVPLPSVPGSPVHIISLKAGDAGVHLAGAAAFLLLRLDRIYGDRPYKKWHLWAMWILWGVAWVVYGSTGRGGMLSALLGLGIGFIMRPQLMGWVRPAVLLTILIFGLLWADVAGLSQVNSGGRRVISFEQIATNFTSILGGDSRSDQEATIEWRINWWTKIVDYTFGGDYFWTGKGFGVNLAFSDGIISPGSSATPNRHPHNITMNILARAGFPGFLLWLLFITTFGLRLLKATTRPGYAGRIATWLFAYWMALFFNAQFDVYFENPMGGMWFWTIVGLSWVFIYRVPKERARQVAAATNFAPMPTTPPVTA